MVGGILSGPLAAPVDDWLASLPAGTYSFPVGGDFMFQFGASGIAPSRVFFTGQAEVQTQAPVVTSGTGESGTTTTVNDMMTKLVLHGTISSDQHEQGYLGPIAMTLTMPSPGQITSRNDSAALADSTFNVNATIEIPNAFGTPTTLHTAVPINFLAREIARFPALGSSYQYRGTQPPISLIDGAGTEQGTLFFASLNPMAGYDFGDFSKASVQGRAYIDANGNSVFDAGDTPLANQAVILQQTAEISGPSGEGGENGSGGPPDGKGEGPTAPITVYTDVNGSYSFSDLGPGAYTVRRTDAYPLSIVSPNTEDHSFTISTLTSGAVLTYDFTNSFTPDQINNSTGPAYPPAMHLVVPNLHLGATEFANAPGQSYINDGVKFGSALTPGSTVPMTITVVVPEGRTAYLSGWLDSNGDGGFAPGDGSADHGEQIQLSADPTYGYLNNYPIGAGVHTLALNMVVPSGASLPANGQLATFARFRLSTTSGLGPDSSTDSATPDGEVEDVPVTIYDASQLGVVQGQTYEDVNGNGVLDPGEPGLDGWNIQLVNLDNGLDNGQVVASQISSPMDMNMGGSLVTEHGIYQFTGVLPGRYELRSTPPALPGSSVVTSPSSEEGVVYRFDVTPGETIGSLPSATTPVSPGWLDALPTGTDTLFTLGQFMLLKGGGGGGHTGGSSGSGETTEGGDSGQPIRLSVVGSARLFHDTINAGGLVPAEITGLQLEGIAVQDAEEGGPSTVLGPVTVKLGIFRSMGTFGASNGGDGETGDNASFTLYLEFDLTALGLGKVVNTRPLNVGGAITRIPMIGTILARQGGGSPIPLRDTVTGAEPLRLVTGSLTTMFGLDYGAAFLGSLSGNVFDDVNGDNVHQAGEAGLAGSTVRVEMVVTEEGPSEDEGGEGSGGNGGNGSGGEGETTTPTVFLTQTDAAGNWSITGLVPGVYKVTVIPPASYGVSGGAGFSYTETVQSQSQIGNIDFGNFPVNDPPILVAPATTNVAEGAQAVFSTSTGNAVAVSDPDAGALPIQLTLEASGGSVSLSQTTGLTFLVGDGTADGRIVVTGTVADIDAALDGLQFQPTAHTSGSAVLTITVDDLGHTGFDGPKTTTVSVPITVTAVAVSPASGNEDEPIPLKIASALVDADGSETLAVYVGGMPAGAALSAGTRLSNGTWLLTPGQPAGLTITSPVHGRFTLTVQATSRESSNGDFASTVKLLSLSLADIAPIVYGPAGQTTQEDVPASFDLGQFNTPGAGPWLVGVSWGDATPIISYGIYQSGDLGLQYHTYAQPGVYTVIVGVADRWGHVARSQFQVDVIGNAKFQSVVVNDGSAQRSTVNSRTVTFDGNVDWLPGAFELRNRFGRPVSPRLVRLNVTRYEVGDQTLAISTFSGPGTTRGSIRNGQYQLAVVGDRIGDGNGGMLDADGDGTPGGTRTQPFFRLAGDVNGDGVVNRLDRPRRSPFISVSRRIGA